MGTRMIGMFLAALLGLASTEIVAEQTRPQTTTSGSAKDGVDASASSEAAGKKFAGNKKVKTLEKTPTRSTSRKSTSRKSTSRKSTSRKSTSRKAAAGKKSASAKKKSQSINKESAEAKRKKSASQKPAAKKSPAIRKQTANVRLPRYYGKLKLSDKQRNKVLAIQQDYQKQIESLQAEIQKLESDRASASRKVLNRSQRESLAKMTTRNVAKAKPKKQRK